MEIVECENHLLFDCDMYATLRDKLITRLNNIPNTYINPDIGTPIDIINNDSLRLNLINLLSPSGVTTAPATPAMQGGGTLGGWHITEFTVFLTKNRSTRQQNGAYLGQLSVRWTQKKYLGVQKAPGGQKAYKKNRKKSGDLFFVVSFFLRQ